MGRPEQDRIAAGYLRFAEAEAHGRSSLYETLARSVASDRDVIAFLAALPPGKRQPNLLFGATRLLFGTPASAAEFRRVVLDNADALREVMLARSTQTNEPGRCAALLPVLAMLPQPLALLEVGASAGLCLLPDFYGYDYGGHILRPRDREVPLFPCTASSGTPLPAALPRIVWRAGLDLDPIDLSDPAQVTWLKVLVWPEQTDRLARFCAAMEIAARQKPRLVKGDLRHDLERLTAEAPGDATLVIFHTAVLAYVRSPAERAEFARLAMSHCDFWVASEAPQIFPDIAARTGEAGPAGSFLIAVNGAPVAWADPHGAWLRWIADPAMACRFRPRT